VSVILVQCLLFVRVNCKGHVVTRVPSEGLTNNSTKEIQDQILSNPSFGAQQSFVLCFFQTSWLALHTLYD